MEENRGEVLPQLIEYYDRDAAFGIPAWQYSCILEHLMKVRVLVHGGGTRTFLLEYCGARERFRYYIY
ncbi:hypothetical protein KM043_015843 [Ampulex compressa]|nr:hypothetical protein KM043_015843 [Ampulex compressa]